jgi:hypothetical protein
MQKTRLRSDRLIGMMHGPGGAVAAARRLLTSSDVQSGFERLIPHGAG